MGNFQSGAIKDNNEFFVGIDLGWKKKRTTGICVLKNGKPVLLKDIFGKDILKIINPYLKKIKVIAIDAPLTQGRGKGKMRLYEKFLSTKIFRKAKVSPLPPALMPKLCQTAKELVEKLEKRKFVLGINLIEVFPTLIQKICQKKFSPKNSLAKTKNQRAALICAWIAFLHSQFKTHWLGYKDGFLFLPEIVFWKKDWQEKFYQAWRQRDCLKYRRLITNIF